MWVKIQKILKENKITFTDHILQLETPENNIALQSQNCIQESSKLLGEVRSGKVLSDSGKGNSDIQPFDDRFAVQDGV